MSDLRPEREIGVHHRDHAARRLRVLHVLDTFESGGAQRVALQLSEWLVARNVDVAILGRAGDLSGAIPDAVHRYAYRGGDVLTEFRALRAGIREFQPDLVHAHQRKETLLSLVASRRLRTPVVEHAHTYLPNSRYRFLSFRGQTIFAVSDKVRRMVVDEFRRPADRVLLIGNTAANSTSAAPIPRDPQAARALRILAVGRLTEQKDPLRFVRVIAAVNKIRPVEGVWVGTGPLLSAAHDLAHTIGSPVTFAGESSDVPGMLDRCDGLLLTSRWEGLPLIALEAYARRRPVIGTYAALGEEIHSTGKAAIVPDDATDDEFADAVIEGLGESTDVQARIEAAHRFSTVDASPDRVFSPVLQSYLRLAPHEAGMLAKTDR